MSDNLLPSDIWRIIGLKLDPPDLIRFRAVSKSLRSLMPLPPLLLLAPSDSKSEGESSKSEDSSEESSSSCVDALYVGGDQRPFRVLQFPHRFRYVGSTGNWLITAHIDKTIRLSNPFSQQQFHLPPQSAFEHEICPKSIPHLEHLHLWKVILSHSSPHQDCVAMAVHNYRKIIAIAKLSDERWTTLRIGNEPIRKAVVVNDVIFFKGRFLAIDAAGRLILCNINIAGGVKVNPHLPEAYYLTGYFKECTLHRVNYLVEWCNKLLQVIKWVEKTGDKLKYRTNRFEVYDFDFRPREWIRLKSLGEHSLFLGSNTSISVRASDYFGLIRKNCIYFTDDFTHGYVGNSIPGGRDMGVFDLEDGSMASHFSGVSTSLHSPPLWIVQH